MNKSNETFKIEKGIPIAPNGSGTPASAERKRKYPFPDMEIGDSFVGSRVMANSAWQWGKKNGVRFVTRRIGDQVRVWRVS